MLFAPKAFCAVLIAPVATAAVILLVASVSAANESSSLDTMGAVGRYTSIALDAMGNPVVSYLHDGSDDLRVLHCGNATCSAGNSITSPDTAGSVGFHTSLVLDAAGNPVVAYHDFTDQDLNILHCGNPTCSAGNVIASVNATGFTGTTPPSLKLDAFGYPVVSFLDTVNGDLTIVHCGNPDCTAANTLATPDTAGFVGGFSSLALDAAGNPVVSYYDASNDRLKLLHCGNAACTAGNSIATPDTTYDVGLFTSLSLDAAGRPVVSYHDTTARDLRVLHCGNADCTAGNVIAIPDSSGDVGSFSSLALDAAGNPFVAYYDATNRDLKVLHCGDPDCTSGNTVIAADTAGDVGFDTSMVLDGLGNPAIAYYDATKEDLKVLRCGDVLCAPTPTPTVPPGDRTRFAVDAIPGGAIDSEHTVPVGVGFSVDVLLDAYTGPPWIAYQVTLDYDDPLLDPLFPGQWEDPPILNVAGGNLFRFVSGPFCAPTDATLSDQGSDDDVGSAQISMACLPADAQESTLATGLLVQLAFRCEQAGTTTLSLRDVADTFMLDGAFETHNDEQANATITCDASGPAISKSPQGNDNNVDAAGDLPLANLFLCEDPDGLGPICAGPNEGDLTFTEIGFSSSPLGAFEFQIKFDHKIFDIDLECVTEADPDPACTALDAQSWDIWLADDLLADPDRVWSADQCFRNVTENYINFACTSTGAPDAGLTGEIDLANVRLRPDADLKFRLRPGNDNGIVRVILDENCELVDPLGHPVEGSIAGGLTPVCGDIAVTVRILEGDLDLDCDVDLGDAQAIAQRYGMVFGLFLYDPWYDLEPNITDFDVDAKDIQKVFGRIGSTCQTPIPPQPPVAPPQI